jgi:hypothetical protein
MGHNIWSRPISMVIRQQHTAQAFSDASYGGMGGWCAQFSYMWRLRFHELEAAGFDLFTVQCINTSLRDFTEHTTHINVLEFVAIIINLWFVLHLVRYHDVPPGGGTWLQSSPTTLSWLRFAARHRSPPI